MLSCTEISFAISLLNFDKFLVKPVFFLPLTLYSLIKWGGGGGGAWTLKDMFWYQAITGSALLCNEFELVQSTEIKYDFILFDLVTEAQNIHSQKSQ